MNPIEFILLAGWAAWFVAYFQLAWRKGSSHGPSYFKMLFPILLFADNSWPPGTEMNRVKLQIFMLLLVTGTAIEAVVEN